MTIIQRSRRSRRSIVNILDVVRTIKAQLQTGVSVFYLDGELLPSPTPPPPSGGRGVEPHTSTLCIMPTGEKCDGAFRPFPAHAVLVTVHWDSVCYVLHIQKFCSVVSVLKWISRHPGQR